MVIGIVHHASIFGGIENQIVSLVKTISSSHTIFFFTRYPESQLAKNMIGWVQVISLYGNLFQEYKIIKEYILKNKIGIIQFHTFEIGLKYRLIKLFARRVKVVVRVHTYIACSWIPNWKKRLYYMADTLSSFCVDKYILNGQYLVDEMQANTWINRKKMEDVIDGTRTLDPNPVVNLIETDINAPRLLMIANVLPHKGHDVLIKALKLLKDSGQNVTCDVVGAVDRDVSYMENLRKMIADCQVEDRIKFLGFVTDVKEHLLTHKIVVLPSDSEGTPNCIMEAMSMKRIVIVTKTGGVPEFVKDGETGFLHKPQDADDMARTIRRVMNYPLKELAQICENGYAYWRKNLSVEAMSQKFLNIYQTL